MPRFSILMANYNNSRYIDDAIQSVLAQTLSDWELILVDDASTDESLSRIEAYLNDPRIRLYAKERNEGYTKTLIYGLSKITSDIVGILDSDDGLKPETIETVHDIYAARPEVGLVLTQALVCDANLVPLRRSGEPPAYLRSPVIWMKGNTHFRSFRLSAYNKTGGLDPTVDYAEDWDLLFKLEEAAPVQRVGAPLYLYRQLSGSVSQATITKYIGYCSTALALYRAHRRRRSTDLPQMPKLALLGWMSAAIRHSLELGRPVNATLFSLRGLRIAPFAVDSWRGLVTLISGLLKPTEARAALGRPSRSAGDGSMTVASNAVRFMQSRTGNIAADRVECIPLLHQEGHCAFGGEFQALAGGQYRAIFELDLVAPRFAEDPIVILDIYENLLTKKVVAERGIGVADVGRHSSAFELDFCMNEGERVEFRVFWGGQCHLRFRGVVVEKSAMLS